MASFSNCVNTSPITFAKHFSLVYVFSVGPKCFSYRISDTFLRYDTNIHQNGLIIHAWFLLDFRICQCRLSAPYISAGSSVDSEQGTYVLLLLGAYPRQDVAAQISLRNCCRSSATLLAAVIVPNVSVMSFSHLCLGFFSRLPFLLHYCLLKTIVSSNVAKVFKCLSSYKIIHPVRW